MCPHHYRLSISFSALHGTQLNAIVLSWHLHMMPSTVLDADSLTDLHNFLSLAPLSIAHIFGYGNYLTFTTCQAVRNHILSSDSTFFLFQHERDVSYLYKWVEPRLFFVRKHCRTHFHGESMWQLHYLYALVPWRQISSALSLSLFPYSLLMYRLLQIYMLTCLQIEFYFFIKII